MENLAIYNKYRKVPAEALKPFDNGNFKGTDINSMWRIKCLTEILSGSDGKGSACNTGDRGSIPGLGGFPGEGNGNPLQYSCLENFMDSGAWQATVHGGCKRVGHN